MQRASTIHSGIMKTSQAALDNHKYPQALESSSAHDVNRTIRCICTAWSIAKNTVFVSFKARIWCSLSAFFSLMLKCVHHKLFPWCFTRHCPRCMLWSSCRCMFLEVLPLHVLSNSAPIVQFSRGTNKATRSPCSTLLHIIVLLVVFFVASTF